MKVLISQHPHNGKIVSKGKLVSFRNLPLTAQYALIHYMSVDGGAWAVEENWPDWKHGEGQPFGMEGRAEVMADIEKFRDRFIAKWGDEVFGYVEVPWEELAEVRRWEAGSKLPTEYDYSTSRPRISDEEYSVPTWPVILSAFPDETFDDGWNRFGMYCKLKLPVPAIWFPE